jgi:two-component system, NarL family, response regulator LiaR
MKPADGSGAHGRISVGVYDEPELVVSGVHGMLARAGRLAEVRAVGRDGPTPDVDVLLCDPVGRALEIEDYLDRVTALTDARLLAFTWSSSPSSVRRVLAAGARGVVSKMVEAAELAAAVHAVHDGNVVAAMSTTAAAGGAGLSQRETEVLDLICRGLSNNEIAAQLYVSVNSVKTYVRQMYQKIGVSRRAQAVAWGLAHGF